MRLYYEPLGIDVELKDGVYGICIEAPLDIRDLCDSFWKQSSGGEGSINITNEEKTINWNKDICVIWNPFAIDVNDRKILGRVYTMLQEIAEIDCFETAGFVNSQIVDFIDKLDSGIQYPLVYNLDMDYQQLFKMYNVKIDMQCDSLVENIVNYIKICRQVLNIEIFISFNSLQYLTVEDRMNIAQMMEYEHVGLLYIDNTMGEAPHSEKWWIVDKDKCIIEL